MLHVFATVSALKQKITSVYGFVKRAGNRGVVQQVSKLTPEMLAECYTTVAGQDSYAAVMQDEQVPSLVRRALNLMQVATGDVVGSDGYRRQKRHEGVALALRFGPSVIFATPNLADQRSVTILLTRGVDAEYRLDLEEECNEMPTYGEMLKIVANDPVGQALAFDLTMRLFMLHVLGVRSDCVGLRQGRRSQCTQEWVTDGSAASSTYPGIFGPLRAVQGPLEASGRGSLHGHWRFWLVAFSYNQLLELLQRDPSTLQVRLRAWMRETVRAVLQTQQSSVAAMPRMFGDTSSRMSPLPFLRIQNRAYGADGGQEYLYKNGEESSLKRPRLDEASSYPHDLWPFRPL
ncbi:MAG: hypothetical protein GY725_22360, partial [bacterium]|nr:hypothetical protein [bacterium]